MEIDHQNLPSDPAVLQRMVVGLLEELDTKDRRLQQAQHWLEQLLRHRYGQKSERVDENQLFLFAVEIAGTGQQVSAEPPSEAAPPKPPGYGRQALPQSLERRRVAYDLADDERHCPECQGQLRHIGEDISEPLEYVPASFYVIEEACQKYACAKGCTVVTADKPAAPIEKGLPGPGLLAQVAVSKYGNHLPLHRQEEIYRRQGVELSRQTMCDWMRQSAELVSPLIDLMKPRGAQFEGGADGRHSGAGPGTAPNAHRPDLDVCGGRRASVHGLPLHAHSQPGRAGCVSGKVPRVSAGRCVLGLRPLV